MNVDGPTLINTNEQARSIAKLLRNVTSLSLDTEFDNRNSYKTKVSIVQIGTNDHQYIIDCLSVDLKIFKEILENETIGIIVFSGTTDIKILKSIYGINPTHIFDIQIAYRYFKEENSDPSLTQVVKDLCNEDIAENKRFQKSNWMIRPIKKELLEYAATDVKYLYQCRIELEKLENYNEKLIKISSDQLVFHTAIVDNHIFSLFDKLKKCNIATHKDWALAYEINNVRNKFAEILDMAPGYLLSNNKITDIIIEQSKLNNISSLKSLGWINKMVGKQIINTISKMRRKFSIAERKSKTYEHSIVTDLITNYNQYGKYHALVDESGTWIPDLPYDKFQVNISRLFEVRKQLMLKFDSRLIRLILPKYFVSHLGIEYSGQIDNIIDNFYPIKSENELIDYVQTLCKL